MVETKKRKRKAGSKKTGTKKPRGSAAGPSRSMQSNLASSVRLTTFQAETAQPVSAPPPTPVQVKQEKKPQAKPREKVHNLMGNSVIGKGRNLVEVKQERVPMDVETGGAAQPVPMEVDTPLRLVPVKQERVPMDVDVVDRKAARKAVDAQTRAAGKTRRTVKSVLKNMISSIEARQPDVTHTSIRPPDDFTERAIDVGKSEVTSQRGFRVKQEPMETASINPGGEKRRLQNSGGRQPKVRVLATPPKPRLGERIRSLPEELRHDIVDYGNFPRGVRTYILSSDAHFGRIQRTEQEAATLAANRPY